MNGVFLAWLVELGVITARDLTTVKRLPLPSELLASGIIFGTLGAMSESPTFGKAARYTAWGLVVATVIPTVVTGYDARGKPIEKAKGALDFLQVVGDFLGGKTTSLQTPNSAAPQETSSSPTVATPLPTGLGGTPGTRSGNQP